eukprot:TRINITY_DN72401_c0_g1_i1.p1 TRINITY_DN72401_c0_g1~~TRINITY_DN72401_c0_g1_i1.p1  ORF type:complete len:680 (+),score=120.63 TRINITY_DN72401_c0_g1_i1:44-2041(+)
MCAMFAAPCDVYARARQRTSRPLRPLALGAAVLLQATVARDFFGFDCTVSPGNGMPLGRYGDGPMAAGGGSGGFCPPEARCRAGDASCIPELGYGGPRPIVWGSASKGGLDRPVALAFRPGKPCELWVMNYGNSSVSLVFNVGSSDPKGAQSFEVRQDISGCHFMHKPTSISFGGALPEGDIPRFDGCKFEGKETFVSTADSRNSYTGVGHMNVGTDFYGIRYGDDFMGPSLWSANLSEFAVKNNDRFPGDLANNPDGSHLSMLHQSSHSMGSVWTGRDTAFWLWDAGVDAWIGSIVLADMKAAHGFGGSDHTHTDMTRYGGIFIGYKPGVQGQMALGENGKWLYVCDPGHGRLLRLDTTSGTRSGDVKPRNEWREFYRSYSLVERATFETLDFKHGTIPSGLVYTEGRIYVSDAATGDIMLIQGPAGSNEDTPLDQWKITRSVPTGAQQIGGMTLDAHKRLWFVDTGRNKLAVLEPRCVTEEACLNRMGGGSPWNQVCAPPMAKDGRTLYKALQEENTKKWGYNVLDMGGCGRSFYAGCPGGDEETRPICAALGGNVADACVSWSHDGPVCSCGDCGVRTESILARAALKQGDAQPKAEAAPAPRSSRHFDSDFPLRTVLICASVVVISLISAHVLILRLRRKRRFRDQEEEDEEEGMTPMPVQ